MNDPVSRPSHHAVRAEHEAPHTIEGWYVLHDAWHVDWAGLRARTVAERQAMGEGLANWLADAAQAGGGSAAYAVVGQKADVLFLHYRRSPADLQKAALALKRLSLSAHLRPAGSFVSVIEASLYEATAVAHGILARRGLTPDQAGFAAALETEMAAQRTLLDERVYRTIPDGSHLCSYPMSKRRGEAVNWYTLSMDDRRKLMRGHGQLGARFKDQVTQVVSGAVGLDDWEWGVDLHAEDPLVFKKLVYAMRFDEASAKYAEFGPFTLGIRQQPAELAQLIAGG